MSIVALDACLAPLKSYLTTPGIAEISINRPGELWIERRGTMERLDAPELDLEQLETLALLIAQATQQEISQERPLLAGYTPQQFRVQVVHHPAIIDVEVPAEVGKPLIAHKTVGLSIRLPTVFTKSLSDYRQSGSFRRRHLGGPRIEYQGAMIELQQLLREWKQDSSGAGEEALERFFRTAAEKRLNILVSGGTSTGKTTFLNALLAEIDAGDRIVAIEDVPELVLHQPNTVRLIASKGEQGIAKVTPQQLLEASLRLRPDRICLGEIRGAEAFTFLSAINSGHPGSVTSIHADSPELALHRLAFCVLQAGSGLNFDEIERYVRSMIHIVVQLQRDTDGNRYVEQVEFLQ